MGTFLHTAKTRASAAGGRPELETDTAHTVEDGVKKSK